VSSDTSPEENSPVIMPSLEATLIMESKCCQVEGDFIDVITKCSICSGSCNEINESETSWQNWTRIRAHHNLLHRTWSKRIRRWPPLKMRCSRKRWRSTEYDEADVDDGYPASYPYPRIDNS
jgi:hypothetical protein